MSALLRKAAAMIRRDFTIESSYKMSFFLDILYSLMPVFTFYFLGKLIGKNYFPSTVIGIALAGYFQAALRSFGASIRDAQMAGSFEVLLSTRTNMRTIILLSPLYNFLFKLIHIVIIISFSGIFLHVDYSHANILSALCMLFVSILAFSSVGILSAACVVIFKRGNPLEMAFGLFITLVSGAYFPVDVLPASMKWIAVINPVKYAIDGARLALLEGYSIPMLLKEIAILCSMVAVLLPLGLFLFSQAIKKVKYDGTLVVY